MTYTNAQLRELAEAAQAHMSEEIALFGIGRDDYMLDAITPAMVRSVLAVVEEKRRKEVKIQFRIETSPLTDKLAEVLRKGADEALIGQSPVQMVEQVASHIEVWPVGADKAEEKPPPPIAAAQIEKPAHQDAEPRLDEVIAFLRANAVDGRMMTQTEYEATRGDLPSRASLKARSGLKWSELALRAGLRMMRPHEAAGQVREAQGAKAAGQGFTLAQADFFEEVKTALLEMANAGQMPSQNEWDAQRPAGMPVNTTIRQRLGLGWTELAQRVGLEPRTWGGRHKRSAAQAGKEAEVADAADGFRQARARVGAATQAVTKLGEAIESSREEIANALNGTRFTVREGRSLSADHALSDAAVAALGPEHILVSGYRE